jgi:hypothetical protein
MKLSRYLVFLLGGIWGCFLSFLIQDTVLWATIGFVVGAFASAFAMVCCESVMWSDNEPHIKYDESVPFKELRTSVSHEYLASKEAYADFDFPQDAPVPVIWPDEHKPNHD